MPIDSHSDDQYRYAAFISYRHLAADREAAMWLHRALERYRPPKAIRRGSGGRERVGVIFRDEDELAASPHLTADIDAALEASRFLIVVCSRQTPASAWVNAEVARFRDLGRSDRVLALLIDGEPAESFPPALRELHGSSALEPASGLARQEELLAADLRPAGSESRRYIRQKALLKLVAPLLGCSYDDLRQRDAEYRTRRARVFSAIAVSLLLVFAGLAALSFVLYRQEGRARRTALGRQLLAQSQLLITQNPSLQELGVLLALEGLLRLEAREQQSVDADRALRGALDHQPRLLQRIAPSERVEEMLASPTGRFIAVRTRDHRVALHAAGEDPALLTLAPGDAATALAFSTDERWFGLSAGPQIQVVDLTQRVVSRTVALNRPPVQVRFATDLTHAASLFQTGPKYSIAIWDLGTGALVTEKQVPEGEGNVLDAFDSLVPAQTRTAVRELIAVRAVQRVDISEDFGIRQRQVGPRAQYFLVSGSVDEASQTYVIEPGTGNVVGVHGAGEQAARPWPSPDGRHVAFTLEEGVTVSRIPDRAAAWSNLQVVTTIRAEAPIRRLAFSTNGRSMVTITDRTARIWDTLSGRERCRVTHTAQLDAVALDFGGGRLWTAATDGIADWACDAAAQPSTSDGFRPDGILHPDGKALAWVRREGLEVVDAVNHRRIALLAKPRGAEDIVWAEYGNRIAAGRHGNPVKIWDWPGAAELNFDGAPPTGRPLAFSSDARYLAIGHDHRELTVFDLATSKTVARIDVPYEDDVAVSEEARFVAARDFDGVARVWNVRNGTMLNADAPISAVALDRAGGRMAVLKDGTIQIHDLETGSVLSKLPANPAPAFLALSGHGRYIAAAADTVVTILPIDQKTPQRPIALDYPLKTAAFDASEAWLATTNERWLQLWNVSSGAEIVRLPLSQEWYDEPGEHPVLRFVSAGRLLSLSTGSRYHLWLWRPADLIESACALLTRKGLTPEEWQRYFGGETYRPTCGTINQTLK